MRRFCHLQKLICSAYREARFKCQRVAVPNFSVLLVWILIHLGHLDIGGYVCKHRNELGHYLVIKRIANAVQWRNKNTVVSIIFLEDLGSDCPTQRASHHIYGILVKVFISLHDLYEGHRIVNQVFVITNDKSLALAVSVTGIIECRDIDPRAGQGPLDVLKVEHRMTPKPVEIHDSCFGIICRKHIC
ncbi:hypothetical protein ATCV1_z397L [Acanthocystis turfacea chlorella virus 1]|uniref:Uncharacterized protein z397L n=1 Tax=Chlorovirus heliozoae TaxID=322019 RepID=A7K907_9PHYC|nr:hypothetical protein ATCV1_z397L [Acanthocystis turfacea chlorella virus 1]ABT16531.1 hypothetical protein ATCV1_z397L [Acanthocystis turfacea chlorella virus 1]